MDEQTGVMTCKLESRSFSTCHEHRGITSETGADSKTIHEVGDVYSVQSERCVGGVRVFTVWTCHVSALLTTDNWTIISGRNCGINAVLRVEARGSFSREEHASLHRHIVAHMCNEVVYELLWLGIPLFSKGSGKMTQKFGTEASRLLDVPHCVSESSVFITSVPHASFSPVSVSSSNHSGATDLLAACAVASR